jgi:hypothetical protein
MNRGSKMTQKKDIHTERAAEMFGVQPASVTPEQRRVAKEENYLRMYAGRPARIDASFFDALNLSGIRDMWREKFPAIRDMHDELMALDIGKVETQLLGTGTAADEIVCESLTLEKLNEVISKHVKPNVFALPDLHSFAGMKFVENDYVPPGKAMLMHKGQVVGMIDCSDVLKPDPEEDRALREFWLSKEGKLVRGRVQFSSDKKNSVTNRHSSWDQKEVVVRVQKDMNGSVELRSYYTHRHPKRCPQLSFRDVVFLEDIEEAVLLEQDRLQRLIDKPRKRMELDD